MIGLGIISLLILSTYIDLKKQIIPNCISLLIVCFACFDLRRSLLLSIISCALSLLILLVPALIKNDCFGGGDIKLVAALGFYLGFVITLQAVTAALLLSRVFAKLTNKKSSFPLAPFLTMAFVPTILYARCFI